MTQNKDRAFRIAHELMPAVNAYLMARTYAELQREIVDTIQRRILETASYYTDENLASREITERKRITEPKYAWMMSDSEFHDYLSDVRHELEAKGYKIEQGHDEPYWSYLCPALCAESLQTDTEHLLIDQAAELLNSGKDFRHTLLCAGMDKYKQFIDLTLKFVINAPGYKAPAIKKEVG